MGSCGVADPQARGRVDQLVTEPLRFGDRADEDDEAGGRAFLAGVPERALHDVGDGEVVVRVRSDDDRVLATGLGEQRQVGPPRAEQLRRLVRPGEDHAVDPRVGHQPLTEVVLGDVDEREQVARDARLPQRLDHDRARALGLRRRLDDHAAARGERRQHRSRGDRDREVPRRGDDGQLRRHEAGALDGVELAGTRRVVVGEVDGFADLCVGFGDRLSGLGRHDFDQAVPVGREREPRAVEDGGTVEAASPAPGGPGLLDACHDELERLRIVHGGSGDRVRAELGPRDPREDLPAPGPVRRERRVGVCCVVEVVMLGDRSRSGSRGHCELVLRLEEDCRRTPG